jgi:integrase
MDADRAPERKPPTDPDTLVAMSKHWPNYPRKAHRSGRARITLARKSIYLPGDWDSDESHAAYDELKARWRAARKQGGGSVPVPSRLTVADAVATYLDWSRLHQSPATTYGYRWYGNAFAALHGTILAAELPRYYVTRWVDEMVSSGRWTSPNTAANAVTALARIFAWCHAEGLLKVNPLAGMKPGKRRSRQRVLTDAEYRALLRGAHSAFRRLLVALRWTGARPCELRAATWADLQYDADGRPARIVLAKHKTATTAKTPRPRVIWLVGPMPRLVAWLMRCANSRNGEWLASSADGPQAKTREICTAGIKNTGEMAGVVECGPQPLFTTETGRPWSAGRLCQVVGERRRAAGLAADCCSYLLRHGYLTAALVNGVPLTTLAELAGNSPATITRTYAHVAAELAHLEAAARQAVQKPRAG